MSESKKFDAKLEQAGGVVKENVGKLTGNKELQSEGFVDKVKGKVNETVEKAKDVVEDVKDSVSDVVQGVKNSLDNK